MISHTIRELLPSRPALARPVRAWAIAVATAVIAACAAPPDKYTAEHIEQATSAGNLAALYDQIAADLEDSSLGDEQRRTMQLRLDEAGRALAQAAEQEVASAVEGGALPSGVVPIAVFEAQKARLDQTERWDPSTFQRVSADLRESEEKTRSLIAEKEAALEALGDAQVAEKPVLLEALAELYGPGTDEAVEYGEQKDLALQAVRERANAAIETEDYDEAQRMLEVVAAVGPSDPALEGKRVEVDAKLFERRFYDALERERPEEAYQALVTLSESENFDKVRPRLKETAEVMADYFSSLGANATEARNWQAAFRYFEQSRDVRERLGLGATGRVEEEQPFIRAMHGLFEKAGGKGMHGLAWGYLNVIAELEPDAPSLRRELRETREKVLQQAVKRLSAARFEDHHRGGSEFGDTVTAKIVQYLFENLSEDVRIIEREKLEQIEKERNLGGGEAQLLAVDYLVEGNILEAKVDSSERPGTQRRRVSTGQETVPNPEWDRWNSMGDRERERAGLTTQPPRTITREKVEDISIATTHHRKVGVFSVSYRVIDAETAKVVFADTQRSKIELEDTSSDGVELGSFQQEFKVANLPSDVEILDDLAEEVSEAIGGRLAEVLVDPEVQYEKDAERFVREGNFVDASQHYAYAVVLLDRKDKDSAVARENLRDSSVSAVLGD